MYSMTIAIAVAVAVALASAPGSSIVLILRSLVAVAGARAWVVDRQFS